MATDIEKLKFRLRELGGRKSTSLTYEEKQEIESLYEEVLGEKFVRTGCNDCYIDGCIIAYNYLEVHGNCAPKLAYKMRRGVVIQLAFGSSEFLSRANCTDKKARKHLAEHPEDIELFEEYPANWKDECKGAKPAPVSTNKKNKVKITTE